MGFLPQAIKKAKNISLLKTNTSFLLALSPNSNGRLGRAVDSDIFYQLGEALKRGVDVICLVPGRDDTMFKHYEFQARRRGADYLRRITESYPDSGRFILSKIHVDGKDPIIHSKVMLVDDELALVGSTNIAQRSMCLCSEIQMAIVDENNQFARDLRLKLWREHMELDDTHSIMDPEKGGRKILPQRRKGQGRLRLLPTTRIRPELPNRYLWDKFIDPYRGPNRD